MLELYIIRHALAGKPLEDEVLDEARPLTKKGRDRMKAIAKGLGELGVSFDVILSSPLPRAKETADIVCTYCGDANEVMLTDLLRPGSPYGDLIGYLNGLEGAEKVAIVGHEPFLSGFASYCLAKSKSPFLKIKKGGVLMIEVEGTLKPGQCRLSWLMEPWQMIGLS